MFDEYWFPHVYIVCSILYYFILFFCERHTNHRSKHISVFKVLLAWLDLTLLLQFATMWFDKILLGLSEDLLHHSIQWLVVIVLIKRVMKWAYYLYTICLYRCIHISYPAGCCVYMQYVLYVYYVYIYHIIHIIIVYHIIIYHLYMYHIISYYIYIILSCWFLVIFWWFRWQTKVLCIACHTESAMASSSGPWP